MILWILWASLIIPPSLQTKCTLQVITPPFSACSHASWGSTLFRFQPGIEVQLPMSSVCNNKESASVPVSVESTAWLKKGYLQLFQYSNGPNYARTHWPNWFIESITVTCEDGVETTFGIARSIELEQWYDFSDYDTKVVPHDSCFISQGTAELTTNRWDYKRVPGFKTGPLIVKKLNDENAYEGKLMKANPAKSAAAKKAKTLVKKIMFSRENPRFTSLEEVRKFTINSGFPVTETINFWDKDSYFETQRLQGANPVIIKMTREIPDQLKLDRHRAEKIMGEPLCDVLVSKRMFLADLGILAAADFYTPMALFFVNKKGDFNAVAIQLTRNNSNNVVYYPDDKKNDWLMAKMYYNLAESYHHQMIRHLSVSHLMLDAIGSLAYRNLLPSHPVFKLIKQQSYLLYANNNGGAKALLPEGGIMDHVHAAPSASARKLVSAAIEERYFHLMNPPLDEKLRQTSTIKVYPYRDRALPLFRVIKQYVEDVISNYYTDDASVRQDTSLRSWRIMLSQPQSCQGGAMKNLPGSDSSGEMTFNELVELVASIVWQLSAGHASVHLPQFHEFGFVLNYPLCLTLPPPSKKGISDEEVVKSLPSKVKTMFAMSVAYDFLFDGDGGFLGDFDRKLLTAPKDQLAIQRFKDRLGELKKKKYESLKYPYHFLDVDVIRNSPRI